LNVAHSFSEHRIAQTELYLNLIRGFLNTHDPTKIWTRGIGIMKHLLLKTSAILALSISTNSGIAFAQANTVEDEVIVTGSYIKRKRQKDLASPTLDVGQDTFDNSGAKDIRDVVDNLTINTGSQNNADVFTQGNTAGTSNINLRGLGVASTLVLLNGRRQVASSVQAVDGVSFVDTNALVPSIAIERLEVLKDGASAIYGSEAVAGVANFITRDDFVGLEVKADAQIRATNGSQNDFQIAAITGVEGDAGHIVFAASYFDRSELDGSEIDFLRIGPGNNTSGAGNPGRFITSGGVVQEQGGAGCEGVGGLQVGSNCLFNFGPNQSFTPNEERIQAFAKHNYDFNDNLSSNLEFAYSQNRTSRVTSPSFPTLFAFPNVPAAHPDNPFGEDVRFIGRPLANGEPSEVNEFEGDTFRVSGGLEGSFNEFDWNVSLTHAVNDLQVVTDDTNVANYELALAGLGGNDCNPATDTAFQGNCLFFNPFLSAIDGSGTQNSAEIIDFIIDEQILNARSSISVLDAVISRPLFEMGGGEAAIAVGVQLRDESLSQDFNPLANAEAFSFVVGNPDFAASRSASAVFGELALPITEQLEVQLAGRFEEIGDFSTFDPKVAARYSVNDNLSLRGSWSTSFRAPSLFQQIGTQTSFLSLSQAVVGGGTTFTSVRTFGDPDLEPEESTAFNIGATFEADNGFEVNVDYWDFDFENVLTQENPQAIFNADPNDPRIRRTEVGTVAQVLTAFVNASELSTNGIDASIRYPLETDAGTFTGTLNGTYVFNYDIVDPQLGEISGAGNRNFTNFATSAPRLRANAGLSYSSPEGRHTGNVFARYISSFDDDRVTNPATAFNSDGVIDAIVTFDAQYNLALGEILGEESNTILTIGALNILDQDPPLAEGDASFDTKVHDPRGRRLYARIKVGF